jgi:hypothetical protein
MADEITISGTFRILNGDLDFSRRTGNVSVTQTGSAMIHNVQLVGSTHEILDVGDVSDPAVFLFINLSSFDIQIGIDQTGVFVPFLKIPSGKFAMGSGLDITAIYAKCSDSEGGNLEYIITQE